MKILALDFGGSSVKYGIVDENANLTETGKLPAPLQSVEMFLDTVDSLYRKFENSVDGIGISLPGNIDPVSGVLFGSGVYTPLYGLSITDLVREKCGVPVSVENDGKCGALSEAWNGSLKDCRDGAVIILGSGIAGGLIKDHKIHSGKWFNAGEFSYAVSTPGDYSMLSCACMQVGMLGVTYKLCKLKNLDLSVQDAGGMLQSMDSSLGSRFPAVAGEPAKIKADGKQFFKWVYEGDKAACAVYEEFKKALGALVFNTQICFAPEKIVIGGGLSKEPPVVPDIKAELEKYNAGYGLSEKMQADVVCSTYRGEANLCGAAYNFILRNT